MSVRRVAAEVHTCSVGPEQSKSLSPMHSKAQIIHSHLSPVPHLVSHVHDTSMHAKLSGQVLVSVAERQPGLLTHCGWLCLTAPCREREATSTF